MDQSPAKQSLSIDLGGTIFEVRSGDLGWLETARTRYRGFIRADRPATVTIDHTPDKTAMRARCGSLSLIDPGGLQAEFAAESGTEILDGLLRTMLPALISPGLMVHGALLEDGDRAFLCCGVSGSGKSTMAELFSERALCDELAVLKIDGDEVEVRSLPFWRARPGTRRLAAIFLLHHGVENERTPLDRAEALRQMRRHVYWPIDREDSTLEAFETLAEVCTGVPVWRLAFRPDRSIWRTMTRGM